jgi:hypothetical protein
MFVLASGQHEDDGDPSLRHSVDEEGVVVLLLLCDTASPNDVDKEVEPFLGVF